MHIRWINLSKSSLRCVCFPWESTLSIRNWIKQQPNSWHPTTRNLSETTSRMAMISSPKLWLVLLVAAFAVAAAEDTESFVCACICGNQKKGLSTPDLVVEYNWNSRIPVCSGLSCETGTCSELQLKLPSYSGQADCLKHQTGLQEAGCECKGAKSSANKNSLPMGTMIAVVIGVINLLLWAGEMEKPTKFGGRT